MRKEHTGKNKRFPYIPAAARGGLYAVARGTTGMVCVECRKGIIYLERCAGNIGRYENKQDYKNTFDAACLKLKNKLPKNF